MSKGELTELDIKTILIKSVSSLLTVGLALISETEVTEGAR